MKNKVSRLSSNYMDLVFARNEAMAWRQEDDGLVEVDMENKGFFNSVAQKFFHRPKVSHISLDRYGSVLWLALDSKNTVSDVLEKMNAAFPDEKEKMLNRVVQFMATLQRCRFIRELKKD